MPKITDDDIRQKIAEVEGAAWLEHDAQIAEDGGRRVQDNSVAHALRTYTERRSLEQEKQEDTIYGAVIYGLGGLCRYYVLNSGEVVFSGHHGRSYLKEAEEAGFRIWF